MKYFLPPYTIENINAQYKNLCKRLHPDKNGDKNNFIEMKAEKENLILAIQKHTPVKKEKRKRIVKLKNERVYKYLHVHINAEELIEIFINKLL